MRKIEFIANGSNSILGNFATGDIAHGVDEALAKHLVEDLGCAKFADTASTDGDQTLKNDASTQSPAAKPSDGLNVADIKAALASRGVPIPEGVTLKADLAALLDGANAEPTA